MPRSRGISPRTTLQRGCCGRPIIGKHDLIREAGSAQSTERTPDRATATGNMHRKFDEVRTNRQTDTLIAIFRFPTGGAVTGRRSENDKSSRTFTKLHRIFEYTLNIYHGTFQRLRLGNVKLAAEFYSRRVESTEQRAVSCRIALTRFHSVRSFVFLLPFRHFALSV